MQKPISLPTQQQCLNYFEQYKVPTNIKKHCLKVQNVALFLAKKLSEAGFEVNVKLISCGALLHDLFKAAAIKKTSSNYSNFTDDEMEMRDELRKKYPNMFENQIAFEVFKEEFPLLAKTLRDEGDPYNRDRNWEESIIHYSDYRVFREEIVSLKRRFAYFREAYPAEEMFWDEYFSYCKIEEKRIFEKLDFSPEELKEHFEIGVVEIKSGENLE